MSVCIACQDSPGGGLMSVCTACWDSLSRERGGKHPLLNEALQINIMICVYTVCMYWQSINVHTHKRPL